MSFLLKIVEGPFAGAEVALVSGTRVKVGPTDDCDIVIGDASLQPFSLDVSDAAVTLVTAAGETRALRPFEIEPFGTTTVAIGPGEGPWQPLVRRPVSAKADRSDKDAVSAEADRSDKDAVSAEAGRPDKDAASAKADRSDKDAASAKAGRSDKDTPHLGAVGFSRHRRGGCGCVVAVLLFLLLALLALAWFLPLKYVEKWPAVADRLATVRQTIQGWISPKAAAKTTAAETPKLADIVKQNGLQLLEKDGHPLVKGNLSRRTERLAVRALALQEDPQTAFDLTDDETLKTSADELLFALTEGALKATAASNRVVTLAGFAPSAAELERAVRALNQDVPGIDRLETAAIQVGGTPPPAVAKTKFAAPAREPEGTKAAAAVAARRDYPIAGIITKPFPLVVMRNGLRLTEGAQVGTAVIERIEADRLILKDGKTTFEWVP